MYCTGCRMAWVPCSVSALCKLWNQSWTLFQVWLWLCYTQRCSHPSNSQHFLICSQDTAHLQLVVCWLSTCSLSPCEYVSCSLMYHFTSGHAYRMGHLLQTWRLLWSASPQQLRERENRHCHWLPAIWRTCGCCRSMSSFFLTRGRWKDMKNKRRTRTTFFLFYMCAEFRHKHSSRSPVLWTNSVMALSASIGVCAFLPHSSKGFIASHCTWTVQTVKVDLYSLNTPHCLL